MSAANKKASPEKRLSRGRKNGVGKPIGVPATWFNALERPLKACMRPA